MDRFFSVCLLLALLLVPAGSEQRGCAQPVFFSMLFPQLVDQSWRFPVQGEGEML